MPEPFRHWPKAELHLHLEGSVEPSTLLEIDPSLEAAEIEVAYRYSDFPGFLKTYAWLCKRIRTPQQYAIATRRLLEALAAQNVSYAEITVSAGVVLWKGDEFAPIYDAVQHEAVRSRVQVRWIVDIVRQFPLEEAWRVAELAAERIDDGVIAIGIGGDEERGPARRFTGIYEWARERGLHLHAHAGETTGPQSIWEALDIGAERIGHGIQAIGDPALLHYLRAHSIPLEICLTSNVLTASVSSIEKHPLRVLYDAGVPIVLNTDDPGLFGCTLDGEFDLARKQFGFTEPELQGIARNAFRFAFERSVSTWAKSMDPFAKA